MNFPWSAWTTWLRPPGLPDPPGGGLPGPPGSPGVVLSGPPGTPGGGTSDPPSDLGSQVLPGQSFMWQRYSTLDQSIADMNQSVMQLLTAHQAASVKLQLQMQQI